MTTELNREEESCARARCAKFFLREGMVAGELGVMHGDHAAELVARKPSRLHLIDGWDRDPSVSPALRGLLGPEIHANVQSRFAEEACVRLTRANSPLAANQFDDETFDWFYIDAGHDYHAVTRDLRAWLPKVKRGGILCGHDYLWRAGDGSYPVHTAVDQLWQSFDSMLVPLAFSNDWVLRVCP